MSSASFGDWIANSGSLVAWISLVVSIATFFITRAEKNKELRHGQAIKVSAWLTDADLDSAHVVVANNSDLPIYGVAIVIVKGPWRYSEEIGKGFSGGAPRDSEVICKVIPPWEISSDFARRGLLWLLILSNGNNGVRLR